MKSSMTDLVALNRLIEDGGLKKTYIAEKLDMSYQALLNKLKEGGPEFTAYEMHVLKEIFHMDDEQWMEIFFSAKAD